MIGTGMDAKHISVKMLQAIYSPVSHLACVMNKNDILTCVHQREAFVDIHGQACWLKVFVPEAGYGLAHGGPFTPRNHCIKTDEG
jgi:hypothetical protein